MTDAEKRKLILKLVDEGLELTPGVLARCEVFGRKVVPKQRLCQ